jgi:site-specific recombinase
MAFGRYPVAFQEPNVKDLEMLKAFIGKWLKSTVDRSGLDSLLGHAPSKEAPLRQRLIWLRKIIHWISASGSSQVTRLRYIFQVLDQNPAMKKNVAELVRSIIADTSALELFMNIGIPNEQGFIGEFLERLHLRFLPQPPRDEDLISVFSETFCYRSDPKWVREIDPILFGSLIEFFGHSSSDSEWNTLLRDARDAVLLLSQETSSIGTSRLVRNRLKERNFRNLPFFKLPMQTERFVNAVEPHEFTAAYKELNLSLDSCLHHLDEVYEHFRDQGVSISLVYQIERLRAMIERQSTLTRLLAGYDHNTHFIQDFLALLIEENYHARRIRGLVNQSVVLVCHKIVETNAKTGEHYISRDRDEHYKIIKSAAGGGLVTGFTAFFKMLLHHLSVAPFGWGLLASLNYSVSFVGIQLLGFTLATKQPAMTATVLASKLDEENDSVEPFIDEIIHLLRSQMATVVGNLITVIPMVMAIDLVYVLCSGQHFTDPEYAKKTIESFSVFGLTPLFAVWTGILLWVSSVFSGLFANWFAFRKLPQAIEHQPRLVFVIGARRAKKFADYLNRNMGGFAANISLAVLMGMTYPIGVFLGIPLDVRHVTLSTGALTAASVSIGASIFSQHEFWHAIFGIFAMGILNLAVSFALALTVAIWAKETTAPSRGVIFSALMKRLISKPWVLLVPARA